MICITVLNLWFQSTPMARYHVLQMENQLIRTQHENYLSSLRTVQPSDLYLPAIFSTIRKANTNNRLRRRGGGKQQWMGRAGKRWSRAQKRPLISNLFNYLWLKGVNPLFRKFCFDVSLEFRRCLVERALINILPRSADIHDTMG